MVRIELPTIASHAKQYGLEPNKKLGQNFLFDLSLCEKIAKSSPNLEGHNLLEIGPGPGGLTRAILNFNPKKLVVIEKDKRCIDLLKDIKQHYSNLDIISGDAMNIKLSEIAELDGKVSIISNLPYNVGTELIFKWLDEIEKVASINVMLQKEVVDRICAKVGTKSYGKLSIMTQILSDVEKLFDVQKEAFHPPPKVTSSIVQIVPKKNIPSRDIVEKVRKITHFAFSQRRKTIKKSLAPISDDIVGILQKLDIDPTLRAENLSVEDYVRLAQIS